MTRTSLPPTTIGKRSTSSELTNSLHAKDLFRLRHINGERRRIGIPLKRPNWVVCIDAVQMGFGNANSRLPPLGRARNAFASRPDLVQHHNRAWVKAVRIRSRTEWTVDLARSCYSSRDRVRVLSYAHLTK